MKQLFIIYTIIGLILTPFIYSNNANSYRTNGNSAYKWGNALGGAIYWPSYLFSIEPEVNGDSLESFQKSIIDIVEYRNNKLFTGQRNNSHLEMITKALGYCLVLEGADENHLFKLYDEIFTKNEIGEEVERIRLAVMKKMDGDDFADIIKQGEECTNKLENSLYTLSKKYATSKNTNVEHPVEKRDEINFPQNREIVSNEASSKTVSKDANNVTDSNDSLDTKNSKSDVHPMVSSILKSSPDLKVIRTDEYGTTYFSDGTTFNPDDIE